MKRAGLTIAILAGLSLALSSSALAAPTVPSGSSVEAYATGLGTPFSIAFSPGGEFGYTGQLFVGTVTGSGEAIYRVPSKGNVIAFPHVRDGGRSQGFAFAPLGSTWTPGLYEVADQRINRYDANGKRTQVLGGIGNEQQDIAFGPSGAWNGSIYFTDSWSPDGLRAIDPNGSARLVTNLPEDVQGLAFGPGGNWGTNLCLCFGRLDNTVGGIRTVDADGVMSDFLVSSSWGQRVLDLAFDTYDMYGGDLFVSERDTNTIYRITSQGQKSVYATGFSFSSADVWTGDIAFGPDGAMYVADAGVGTVWRIVPEPATLCLLVSGGIGLVLRRRNKA